MLYDKSEFKVKISLEEVTVKLNGGGDVSEWPLCSRLLDSSTTASIVGKCFLRSLLFGVSLNSIKNSWNSKTFRLNSYDDL